MAKKEKLEADDFEFKDDLDFPEFDDSEFMGNVNPDVTTNNRSPVLDTFTGTVSSFAGELVSPSSIVKTVKDSLPDEYGHTIGVVNEAAGAIGNLYDQAVKEIKPQAQRLAKKVDKLVPDDAGFIKSITTKVSSILGDETSAYRGPTREELENQSISQALGSIFVEQSKQENETNAKDEAREQIRENVESKRFTTEVNISSAMAGDIQAMRKYGEGIDQAYKKKHLELEFRQYFTQEEILRQLETTGVLLKTQLDAVVKNTGLPEYVKVTNTERLKGAAGRVFAENAVSGLFGADTPIGGALKNLKSDVMDLVSKAKQSFDDAMFGVEAVEQYQEGQKMLSEMGMGDSAGTQLGRLIGSMAGGYVRDKATPIMKEVFSQDSQIVQMGHRLKDYVTNPAGHIEDYKNSQEYLDRVNDTEKSESYTNKAIDYAMGLFRERSPAFAIGNPNEKIDLTGAAKLDNALHRAVVEIIPGYLSYMVREQRWLRTGEDPGLMKYDHTRGEFSGKESIKDNIKKTIANQAAAGSYDWGAEKVMDVLFDDVDIEPDLAFKAKQLISDLSRLRNFNFTPENIRKSKVFEEADSETRGLFEEAFTRKFKPKPTSSGIEGEEEEDPGDADVREKFNTSLKKLQKEMPDFRGGIESFMRLGQGKELVELGIAYRDESGTYHIDPQKYHEYVRDHAIRKNDYARKAKIRDSDLSELDRISEELEPEKEAPAAQTDNEDKKKKKSKKKAPEVNPPAQDSSQDTAAITPVEGGVTGPANPPPDAPADTNTSATTPTQPEGSSPVQSENTESTITPVEPAAPDELKTPPARARKSRAKVKPTETNETASESKPDRMTPDAPTPALTEEPSVTSSGGVTAPEEPRAAITPTSEEVKPKRTRKPKAEEDLPLSEQVEIRPRRTPKAKTEEDTARTKTTRVKKSPETESTGEVDETSRKPSKSAGPSLSERAEIRPRRTRKPKTDSTDIPPETPASSGKDLKDGEETSDMFAKQDIKEVDPEAVADENKSLAQKAKSHALKAIEKTKIYSYKYKPGKGREKLSHASDEKIGPMAQDVRRNMGDDVAPDGKKIDVVKLNGVTMAAVKAVNDKVDKLKAANPESKTLGVISKHTKGILEILIERKAKLDRDELNKNVNQQTGTGGAPASATQAIGTLFGAVGTLAATSVTKVAGAASSSLKFLKDSVLKPGASYVGKKIKDNKEGIKDGFTSLVSSSWKAANKVFDVTKDAVLEHVPKNLRRLKNFAGFIRDKATEMFNGVTDVYVKGKAKPALRAMILKAGGYIDSKTGKAITSFNDLSKLKGDIHDEAGNIVLTLKEAAEGLYNNKGMLVKTNVGKFASFAGRHISTGLARLQRFGNFAKEKLLGLKSKISSSFDSEDGSWFGGMFSGGSSSDKVYEVLVEIRDTLQGKPITPHEKVLADKKAAKNETAKPVQKGKSILQRVKGFFTRDKTKASTETAPAVIAKKPRTKKKPDATIELTPEKIDIPKIGLGDRIKALRTKVFNPGVKPTETNTEQESKPKRTRKPSLKDKKANAVDAKVVKTKSKTKQTKEDLIKVPTSWQELKSMRLSLIDALHRVQEGKPAYEEPEQAAKPKRTRKPKQEVKPLTFTEKLKAAASRVKIKMRDKLESIKKVKPKVVEAEESKVSPVKIKKQSKASSKTTKTKTDKKQTPKTPEQPEPAVSFFGKIKDKLKNYLASDAPEQNKSEPVKPEQPRRKTAKATEPQKPAYDPDLVEKTLASVPGFEKLQSIRTRLEKTGKQGKSLLYRTMSLESLAQRDQERQAQELKEKKAAKKKKAQPKVRSVAKPDTQAKYTSGVNSVDTMLGKAREFMDNNRDEDGKFSLKKFKDKLSQKTNKVKTSINSAISDPKAKTPGTLFGKLRNIGKNTTQKTKEALGIEPVKPKRSVKKKAVQKTRETTPSKPGFISKLKSKLSGRFIKSQEIQEPVKSPKTRKLKAVEKPSVLETPKPVKNTQPKKPVARVGESGNGIYSGVTTVRELVNQAVKPVTDVFGLKEHKSEQNFKRKRSRAIKPNQDVTDAKIVKPSFTSKLKSKLGDWFNKSEEPSEETKPAKTRTTRKAKPAEDKPVEKPPIKQDQQAPSWLDKIKGLLSKKDKPAEETQKPTKPRRKGNWEDRLEKQKANESKKLRNVAAADTAAKYKSNVNAVDTMVDKAKEFMDNNRDEDGKFTLSKIKDKFKNTRDKVKDNFTKASASEDGSKPTSIYQRLRNIGKNTTNKVKEKIGLKPEVIEEEVKPKHTRRTKAQIEEDKKNRVVRPKRTQKPKTEAPVEPVKLTLKQRASGLIGKTKGMLSGAADKVRNYVKSEEELEEPKSAVKTKHKTRTTKTPVKPKTKVQKLKENASSALGLLKSKVGSSLSKLKRPEPAVIEDSADVAAVKKPRTHKPKLKTPAAIVKPRGKLGAILGGVTSLVDKFHSKPQAAEEEVKPKHTRRTKAQIEEDKKNSTAKTRTRRKPVTESVQEPVKLSLKDRAASYAAKASGLFTSSVDRLKKHITEDKLTEDSQTKDSKKSIKKNAPVNKDESAVVEKKPSKRRSVKQIEQPKPKTKIELLKQSSSAAVNRVRSLLSTNSLLTTSVAPTEVHEELNPTPVKKPRTRKSKINESGLKEQPIGKNKLSAVLDRVSSLFGKLKKPEKPEDETKKESKPVKTRKPRAKPVVDLTKKQEAEDPQKLTKKTRSKKVTPDTQPVFKDNLTVVGTKSIKDVAAETASIVTKDKTEKPKRRRGNWEDKVETQKENDKKRIRNVAAVDTKAKYKSEKNVIDTMLEKASGVFDFLKNSASGVFDTVTDMMGKGKGGILRTVGNLIKAPFTGGMKAIRGIGTPIANAVKAVSKVGTVSRLVGAANMVRNATLIAGLATGGSSAAATGIIGTGMTALSAAITSPVILGVAAIGAAAYGGYKLYKYTTRNDATEFDDIRLKQYGLGATDRDKENNHYIFALEDYLQDGRVGYLRGKAFLHDKKIEEPELLELFDIDKEDKERVSAFTDWFSKRFKPFFINSQSALFAIDPKAKFSSVEKFTVENKLKYLNSIGFESGPYDETVSPFKGVEKLNADKQYALGAIKVLIDKLTKQQKDPKKLAVPEVPKNKTAAAPETGTQQDKNTSEKRTDADKPKPDLNDPRIRTNKVGKIPGLGEGDGKTQDSSSLGDTAASPASQTVPAATGPLADGSGGSKFIRVAKDASLAGVNPSLEKNLNAMAQEYGEKTNSSFGINSGHRDSKKQEALYRANPAKAARPGTSMHEFGLAVDINSKEADKLESLGLLRKYGFTRPVSGEPWHVEPAGIQQNLSQAKNDPNWAASAIESGIGQGGGGVGADRSSRLGLGRRDPQAAAKIQTMKDAKVADKPAENQTAVLSKKPETTQEQDPGKVAIAPASKQGDQTVQRGGAVPAASLTTPKKTPLDAPVDSSGSEGEKPVNATMSGRQPATIGDQTEANQAASTVRYVQPKSDKVAIAPASKQGDQTVQRGGAVPAVNANPGNKESVKSAIAEVAKAQGEDPSLMQTFAAIESGLNPNAKANSSSAQGLFQFIQGTWKAMMAKNASKYNLNPNTSPSDIRTSTILASEYIKDNRRALKSVKSDVNAADLYMAHFLGTGGARKMLSSPQDAIAANINPKAARANKAIFYDNNQPITVGALYEKIKNKVSKKAKDFGINLNVPASELKPSTTASSENTTANSSNQTNSTKPTQSIQTANTAPAAQNNTTTNRFTPPSSQAQPLAQETQQTEVTERISMIPQNNVINNPSGKTDTGQAIQAKSLVELRDIMMEQLSVQKEILQVLKSKSNQTTSNTASVAQNQPTAEAKTNETQSKSQQKPPVEQKTKPENKKLQSAIDLSRTRFV